MFYFFVILPFLLAPLSALSPPSNPSIKLQPFNATLFPGILQDAEWPSLPWTYRDAHSGVAIVFMAYGRRANIDLFRKIIANLDSIILTLLALPYHEFSGASFHSTSGIVRVIVNFTRLGVRTTSVALAVQQVRDLMANEYGPREIGAAAIWAAGASRPVARFEVLFNRV